MGDEHSGALVARQAPLGELPRITPREREILVLIAEGLTDQEIAQRLWVSRTTVRTHLAHMRDKFQVHNRVALIHVAAQLGFISLRSAESSLVRIGDASHLGYTPDQEVALELSPEQAGGEASGDDEGEAEMLNPRLRFWYLAALLALVGRDGSAAAEIVDSARGSQATAPGVVLNPNDKAARMVTRRVWTGPGVDILGAPSPDGRYLSFVDWETGDLALRDLVTGKSRRLTNKGSWLDSYEWALSSSISPDGKRVAYAWMNKEWFYELRVIGLDGSAARVLYRDVGMRDIQPVGWSPDGKQILALGSREVAAWTADDGPQQILWISAADGSMRVIKALERGRPKKLSLSPDGRTIAYDFPIRAGAPERHIRLLASDGSGDMPLVRQPANDFFPLWAPDGQSLLFASDRAGTLGAWRVRIAGGKPQGAPELVKREMGTWAPLGFSRNGSLYYGLQAGMMDVYIATLDAETGRLLVPPEPANPRLVGSNCAPAWSPDGRYLAYLSAERHSLRVGNNDESRIIAIRSVESGAVRELVLPLTSIQQPSWSTDERFLLATGEEREGRRGAFRIEVQSGAVTPVWEAGGSTWQRAWSPDGKCLFYVRGSDDATRPGHLLKLRDLETGREKELYHGGVIRSMALSPDGRQLAFSAEYEGMKVKTLQVMPAAGGAARELLRDRAPEGIRTLAWMPDGRHLLFGRGNYGEEAAVWRIPLAGGEPQRTGLAMRQLRGLCVHPDGRRVAFTAGLPEAEVWVMENLLPATPARKYDAPRR